MAVELPTSAHNEALPGDTLTTISLNYQWRRFVAIAIYAELKRQFKSEIEGEQDQFNTWIDDLMTDLRNVEENMADNTPVGSIVAFIGLIADIPARWLPCNNSTYVGADYPELFAILKPTFISGANFNTPNLQGHYIRGAASDSDHSGESGANSHTLTIAELPVHNHVVPAHAHSIGARAALGSTVNSAALGGVANTSIATDTEPATNTSDIGSGTAFSVEPLHYRFHWIIKALP